MRVLDVTKQPSTFASHFLFCQWRIMLAGSSFLLPLQVLSTKGDSQLGVGVGWTEGRGLLLTYRAFLGSPELGLWCCIIHSVKIPHLRVPGFWLGFFFWLSCSTGYHEWRFIYKRVQESGIESGCSIIAIFLGHGSSLDEMTSPKLKMCLHGGIYFTLILATAHRSSHS